MTAIFAPAAPNSAPTTLITSLISNGNAVTINIDGRPITTTVTYLTPLDAAALLEHNSRNRPISKDAVDRMVTEIIEGDWDFNGDTIRLARDDDGTIVLVDGQHRLAAIVAAGISVPVIIVENLDPAVTDTIDQGRPRSVPDILRMTYGVTELRYSTVVAAAARTLLAGKDGINVRRSRKQIADYVYRNLDTLRSAATWAALLAEKSQRVVIDNRRSSAGLNAGPLAALGLHMRAAGANWELLNEFFERIAEGTVADSDKTNVIPAIRRRQQHGQPLGTLAGGNGSQIILFTEFSVYISAYNKWVTGQTVTKFQSPRDPVRLFADLPAVSTLTQRSSGK